MDAKSLLRAKKAAAKIDHPYASYSAAGQLKCSICASPVKQWDAHLLTKQHRQSVQREREIEARAASKRRNVEDDGEGDGKGGIERADTAAKRAKVNPPLTGNDDDDMRPALPAGFFSAGNGPTVEIDDEDEDEAGPSVTAPVLAPAPPAPSGDAELDDFLASLDADDEDSIPAVAPVSAPGAAPGPNARRHVPSYKEFAPGVASYEAAPVRLLPDGAAARSKNDGEDEDEPVPPEPEETEAERRERMVREEREEIMGRLEEEERAQEDADSRVNVLKARMEALKKRREAKAAKAKAA